MRRRAGNRKRIPMRTCTDRAAGRDRAPKMFICMGLAFAKADLHCKGTFMGCQQTDLFPNVFAHLIRTTCLLAITTDGNPMTAKGFG